MTGFELLPHSAAIKKFLKEAENQLHERYGVKVKLEIKAISDVYFIDAIVKLVSDTLFIPINHLLGTMRAQEVVEARQVAVYLANKYVPGVKYVDIAAFFSKDHTTILHSERKIKALMSVADTQIKAKVTACETKLLKLINDEKSSNETEI